MARDEGSFWESHWFYVTGKLLGAGAFILATAGGTARLFVYPLAYEISMSMAKQDTPPIVVKTWAWAFAAGWGLFVAFLLVMVVLVVWHRYSLSAARRHIRTQVELGVGCWELCVFLEAVEVAVRVATKFLEGTRDYKKHEVVRSRFMQLMKRQLSKLAQAQQQKGLAFNALMDTDQGSAIVTQIPALLKSLDVGVFAPANRACPSSQEWEERVTAILEGASATRTHTQLLRSALGRLDPTGSVRGRMGAIMLEGPSSAPEGGDAKAPQGNASSEAEEHGDGS